MRTIKSILATLIIMATLTTFAQETKVDTKNSTLKWHCKKVGGEHSGTINLKEGNLVWKNNKLGASVIIIDMTSIVCTDLEDAGHKAKLEGHLKADDFFGVEKFPTAKLEIKSSSAFTKNKGTVEANLTIKDITHPIEFIAQKDGNKFIAEIVVDRSKYDVRYGSSSFFDNLGDKAINDEFTMTVVIVTLD